MFTKILVANRGEIASRIIHTLKTMGIASVAVYSDPDQFTAPVLAANQSVGLGGTSAAETYLNIDAIIAACHKTGAQAVHPGYGFLSERPQFAESLAAAGIVFIGPSPANMRAFALKHTARDIANACGVPLAPGSGLLETIDAAQAEAARIGYPVMLKSTAGGGGIGMQLCENTGDLALGFATAQRQAGASFGDARVYLEKFITHARHIEVQIFGDGTGNIVILGDRDCSLQRRNQKVVEETPAPNLPNGTRVRLHQAARALGEKIAY